MRLPSLVVAVLLTATLLSGTAAATGNAPPLADAGLDQTVPANATVYLDANGTRDPDGTIARVEWSVETPSGATTSPDCRACRQTHFRPTVVGQYNVTVTVTDDDGATRSDTLHVVVSPSSGPSVSLTGPGTVTRDDAATFTADTEGTDTTLSTLAWVVDGNVTDRTSLSGENASVSTTHAFGDAGTRSVRAVVYDAVGRRGTATKRVVVVTDGSVGGTLSDGGSSSDDCHFWNNDCPGDVVLTDSTTGEQTIVEGNGDGGIQMWVGGEYVTASKYVDVDQFRTDDISGGYEYGALEQAVETRKNLEDAWMDGSRGGQVESSGGSSEAGSVTSGSSGDPTTGR
ncbi:PKD domain-containing protein [Haloarcula sp. JP-L23]|uniref:PKD domain-containing protein n=1 Tax=Haloarcula sp. JP-L23 TaxID=2716717 RepID=UPI00140F0C0D|nr:hypothetical protein G9465_06170 [Haloarcula sp. JP-L23]